MLELLKLVGFSVFVIYPIFVLMFLGYARARQMKKEGTKVHTYWVLYPVYLSLIYFLILDVMFNFFAGTVIFKEPPRYSKKEFLFTSRVRRWVKEADRAKKIGNYDKRYDAAYIWRDRLNRIDPGHI